MTPTTISQELITGIRREAHIAGFDSAEQAAVRFGLGRVDVRFDINRQLATELLNALVVGTLRPGR